MQTHYTFVVVNLAADTDELGSGSDNRDIMDDGASQELTEQNITEMKGQGASGKVHAHPNCYEHVSTLHCCTGFLLRGVRGLKNVYPLEMQ